VNAAKTAGKSVWIPAGKYLINSLAGTPPELHRVKVQGAGMWYTTLYRKVPLPTPSGWRSQILVGSGTTLTDLQIDANAIYGVSAVPAGSTTGSTPAGRRLAGGPDLDPARGRQTG